MKAFTQHQGIVAPLLRANIDTDAIIPSREMKTVSRVGLGDGLFAGWRYVNAQSREPNNDFVLNQSAYQNASILLAGPNLGCGSSREHAVWALQEYGFAVLIAPSFGSIFERNCYNNGILPVTLSPAEIDSIAKHTQTDPQSCPLQVNLETQQITLPDDSRIAFNTPDLQREMLINGWDPIDLTLCNNEAIEKFEQNDRARRPWVYQNVERKARK